MEINSKIHVEQPAPPGVHRQRSHKRDGQTNRQTKKLNVFGCCGGGWNPSPTKLGMGIEDLEHVLAPQNFLWSDAQFRSYAVLKIWQKPDTINLKPPITP